MCFVGYVGIVCVYCVIYGYPQKGKHLEPSIQPVMQLECFQIGQKQQQQQQHNKDVGKILNGMTPFQNMVFIYSLWIIIASKSNAKILGGK